MGWGATEQGWRKGLWIPEEDKLLTEFVNLHGEGTWSSVARSAGLNRSGKSCRLRWMNYLRPGLKRGHITLQEEGIIIELNAVWDKDYWRIHFKKKEKSSQKQQPQQQQQQQHEDNMNRVSSHADTSNEKIRGEHDKQKQKQQQEEEEVFMQPPAVMENQSWPAMCQDVATWPSDQHQIASDDLGLWSGLWTFDDNLNGHVDARVSKECDLVV
nr:MYB protein [Zanthoxylum bungeanum]